MILSQCFFGLANAPPTNASSGSKANFRGLSAHSGKWRIVPSASLNFFQSEGGSRVSPGFVFGISVELTRKNKCEVERTQEKYFFRNQPNTAPTATFIKS